MPPAFPFQRSRVPPHLRSRPHETEAQRAGARVKSLARPGERKAACDALSIEVAELLMVDALKYTALVAPAWSGYIIDSAVNLSGARAEQQMRCSNRGLRSGHRADVGGRDGTQGTRERLRAQARGRSRPIVLLFVSDRKPHVGGTDQPEHEEGAECNEYAIHRRAPFRRTRSGRRARSRP